MAITIYKNAYHVGWDTKGIAVVRAIGIGGGESGLPVNLANYYTIEQLGTPGASIVDFENIANIEHNLLPGLQGGTEYSDSAPPDSDDSSGVPDIIHEYYHLDFENYNRVLGQNFTGSLVENIDYSVELDGDVVDPGFNYYYGTNGAGTKGWYPLPEDLVASSGAPVGESLWEIDSNNYLTPITDSTLRLSDGVWDLFINANAIWSGQGDDCSLNIAAGSVYEETISSNVLYAGDLWLWAGWASNAKDIAGDVHIEIGYNTDNLNFGNIFLSINEGGSGGLHPKTTETNVVYYDTTTGLLTYGEVSTAPGGSLEDDILQWYSAGNYYRPYPSMPSGMIYTYKAAYGGLYNWNGIGYDCTFSDWYMPSATELYDLLAYVSPSPGTYISSTEDGAETVIGYDEERTEVYPYKNTLGIVWPIREIHDYGSIYLSLSPGDTGPSGGMIFAMQGNGHVIYYEAAQSADVFSPNEWSNITNAYTELETGSGLGQGLRNTIAIIGQNGHTASAASACRAITSHVEIIAPSFVAPVGWHVPTSTEICTLVDYARDGGSYTDAGRALAEVDADYWDDISQATNSTGFSARGAGRRNAYSGDFENINLYFFMWASDNPGWYGLMIDNSAGDFDLALGNIEADNNDGYSVRLIQDNIKDRDGNEYHTVILNGLEWTIENLKVSRYADGSQIPLIEDNTDWSNDTSGARCAYDNDGYFFDFGYLYNGYAIDNDIIYFTRGGAHETGWRLPTQTEWEDMCASVEESGGLVPSLKDTNYWNYNGGGPGTNTSLFTAKAGGMRNADGTFGNYGNWFQIFTSTISGGTYVVGEIYYDHTYTSEIGDTMAGGYYVRAVRPASTVTMTDNDGNSYSTVKIGTQRWTTTNLKVEEYRNSDPIPYITANQDWIDDYIGGMSYYNNEQESGVEGPSLVFYTGTQGPTGTDRLNLNGILHVTGLYVDGVEITPGGAGYWEMNGDILQPIDDQIDGMTLYGAVEFYSAVLKRLNIGLDNLWMTDETQPNWVCNYNGYTGYSYSIYDSSNFGFLVPTDWKTTTDIGIEFTYYVDEALDSNIQGITWGMSYWCCPTDGTEQIHDTTGNSTGTGDVQISAMARTLQRAIMWIGFGDIAINDYIGINFYRENSSNNTTAEPVIVAVNVVYTADKIGIID